VMFWTRIRVVLGSNVDRDICFLHWFFLQFSSVTWGKCRDCNLIWPWSLPSKSLPVH
jgi:hypothetical protein